MEWAGLTRPVWCGAIGTQREAQVEARRKELQQQQGVRPLSLSHKPHVCCGRLFEKLLARIHGQVDVSCGRGLWRRRSDG